MKPSRRWPAVALNCSSLGEAGVGCRVSGVGESAAGSGCAASGGGATTASDVGFSSDSPLPTPNTFFAFFRIFTRSTMNVVDPLIFRWRFTQAMLAGGGGDARCVNRFGVVAEGIEQRGCGERVEHARNAAAGGVHGAGGVGGERIPRAAADADAGRG